MQRKGQAAMEFLMTYGWAILVVLAAIGALAYFGVFSTGSLLPDRCTAAAGFSCVDMKVDSTDDEVRFAIIQNTGENIGNVTVTLTDSAGTVCTRTTPAGSVPSVMNGQRTDLVFDCGAIEDGDRFQAQFAIEYERGSNTFTDRGEIRATGRE